MSGNGIPLVQANQAQAGAGSPVPQGGGGTAGAPNSAAAASSAAGANRAAGAGANSSPSPSDTSSSQGDPRLDYADKVRSFFVNGPIQAGAVTDPDAFDGGKAGIYYNQQFTTESIGLSVFVALKWRCSRKAAQGACGIAMLIATFPELASPGVLAAVEPSWYAEEPTSGTRTHAEISEAEDEFETLDIRECIDIGLGLLIAAKVNWWKTNHHTGVKVPQGYFKKATDMMGICQGSTAAADLAAVWRAVHWVDTKLVLHAFGIKDLTVEADPAATAKSLFALTDDAQLRVFSNPAGTAKWCDVWVGITQIEGDRAFSMHGHAFPEDHSYYAAIHARCCSGDPTLHMGSQYLCGKPRERLPDWSEGVHAWVVTCVHAMNSSSTLLEAQVFKSQSPAQTTLKAIKAYREGVAAALAEDTTTSGLSFGAKAREKKAKK